MGCFLKVTIQDIQIFKNKISFRAYSFRIKEETMTKKCIYCKSEISDSSVIDFCDRCGVGVWGEKMFKAIVASMENARDNNDLELFNNTSRSLNMSKL